MPDKTDANQSAILRALASIGAVYRTMSRETGFDLLIGFRGGVYLIEVKNPAMPPSERKLTPNELRTHDAFARVGVDIAVCLTLDDVLRTIGAA